MILCSCGSVRHNLRLEVVECEKRADSLQVVIWNLQEDVDSLKYKLETQRYKYTEEIIKWKQYYKNSKSFWRWVIDRCRW